MPALKHLLIGALLAISVKASAADPLFPFVMPWDDASASPTNLSARLEKPAGGRGFVGIKDGRLAIKGKRVRFLGVNLCFGACFPTHADAEKVAARMAKLGIGCVRFHHMDTLHAPEGLLRADRRTLDPAMLDRLDYFIAALKKNGIYTNLNLHVGRIYPGMPIWQGMPQYFKGVDQFFPAMIESQKEFARALLTHVNPYTGKAYYEEPAVAFVEINNENSLIGQWWQGGLDALPEPYSGELQGRWSRWLESFAGTGEKVRALLQENREPLGEELLKTVDREKGDWVLEQHGEAKAGMAVRSNAGWSVDVSRPGTEAWHVQVNRPGLRLLAGKPYTFTFAAQASKERRITVTLSQIRAPWNVLWTTQIEVGPEHRDYRLIITPGAKDEEARIGFTNLGQEAGRFLFTTPSLRQGTAPAISGDGEPVLLRKRDFAGNGLPLQQAWIRFLWEQERTYWQEMARFLKSDLKVRSLLIGTQAGFSPLPLQAELDVVDVHGYWQHPVFPKQEWDSVQWTVHNISMAGAPGGGALGPMAMMRPAGKPFICTEYSHPAPNTYGTESLPLLAAYAALQDWDAVFAFAYSHRRDDWDARRFPGFFDIDQHPVKLATLPAAFNLFCRGDLQPSESGSIIPISPGQALEAVRLAGPALSAETFGVNREDRFLNRVSVTFDGQTAAPAAKGDKRDPIGWESGTPDQSGVVTIDTAKTKGVIGRGTGRKFTLGDVSITPGPALQDWSVILVTELDRTTRSRKAPKRFLVTATGTSENTGMGWKNRARSTVGKDWGTAPSLVEGISTTVGFTSAKSIRAWALDERGQRGAEVPTQKNSMTIGPEHRTLWYEVEVP